MPTYKTPGVFTEEISLLPPSVAEVATAVPAFIGYTEKAADGAESLRNKPTRITSLLDYATLFGGPQKSKFTVNLDTDKENNYQIKSILLNPAATPPKGDETSDAGASGKDTGTGGADDASLAAQTASVKGPSFLLYYSLDLYFKNGGGPCYIVSIGDYSQNPDKGDFSKGLAALVTEDEPTLILLTDAVSLNEKDYYSVCQDALTQCSTLGSRFAIFDVLSSDNARGKMAYNFRCGVAGELKYSAAYFPYLQTTINHSYLEEDVTVKGFVDDHPQLFVNGLRIGYNGPLSDEPKAEIKVGGDKIDFMLAANKLTITLKTGDNLVDDIASAWSSWPVACNFSVQRTTFINEVPASPQTTFPLTLNDLKITSKVKKPAPSVEFKKTGHDLTFDYDKTANKLTITIPSDGRIVEDIVKAWNSWSGDKSGFDLVKYDSQPKISAAVPETPLAGIQAQGAADYYLGHTAIKTESTSLYNQIKAELAGQRVILPPSPAIAGVYARVDRSRGVWSAPANEALMSVIKPMERISNDDQDNLNIDVNAGKSINAIRSFAGKGVLIWGSRTLAGNDNEWRYIPVRRLFIMVETSVKKSTAWAVFGPNDAMAWLKVKAMIESYLEGLWRQGALVGSKAEQAFFVHVGLGQTMTPQDILEGRMIIEIGLAAVRPAEFIILRFSHKMQES